MTTVGSNYVYIVIALLLAVPTLQTSSNFNLTILHTNDIHARVQEIDKYNGICSKERSEKNECFGGYARLKTEVDKQRQENPNSILVDGGDQYQGSLWFYLYGGVVMSHFMNLVGYTAMGLGNHEFDNGPAGLVPFLENSTFPVLSSNMDTSKHPELNAIKPSTVIERGSEKIGIIGYTTVETPFISNPGNIEFAPEIDSIQAEANKLREQGVNIIIAIGHAGYHKDMEIGQKVTGVDVIVGGHTNTFLYTGPPPSSQTAVGEYPTVVTNPDGDKVLIVQDYAYGKYLGKLKVTFNAEGKVEGWSGNPILLDHHVERDPGILDDVAAYLPDIEKKRQDKIGTSLVNLIGDRSVCRRYECNMGNLITDAMVRTNLRYSDGIEWSRTAMAFVNGGGIRASLGKGQISVADVLAVQPFGNTVDIVELSGQTILAMLEHSAGIRIDSPDGAGGFLQISGIRVIYDQEKPIGRRVHRADILCTNCSVPEYEPLDKMKIYMVLMQSYLIEGPEGYDMIPKGIIKHHTVGNLDSDILMDYIRDNTPITTGLDGRIRFLKDIKKQKLCDSV